ncbi:MAG: hypothetical protein LBV21_00285 [Candidatus Adiutrix sp.]|jgi:chemotaxis protein methyltransferase CheR|nr:hypothetical protein [Candidatus Adiutrix sp.]
MSIETPLRPEEAAAIEDLAARARALFGAAGSPRGRGRLLAAARERQARLALSSLAGYGAALRADPGEWGRLWPLALDSGGAFFRPAPQFEVAREILSEWAVGAPERTLRVLALGCGAGFETISLAVTLEEAGFRFKNWRVVIHGLDLNPEAVVRAEAGFFRADDLEWLTAAQRKKWFAARAGGFVFKDALAPPVHLAVGNAYEPEAWPWAGLTFDLIFCRELTFEASPEAPGRLAEILLAALTPTGFLFTAPGEFLPDSSGELVLEERAGVTWYRRGLRRPKANPPHAPKRRKKDPPPEAAGREDLAPREKQLLDEGEALLAQGRPDEARDLANEMMRAALEQARPAWAAWAFVARLEAALGRRPAAGPPGLPTLPDGG